MVAKEFLKAVTETDAKKMKGHFADKVLVAGDLRFVAPDAGRKPTEVSKDQLADAYAKLFERIGRGKWTDLLKKVQPTLSKATKDGEYLEFVKAGDYVYDLHFREALKGRRKGLDEAVIFVFRKVDGRNRIVAHFADY
jgi:hypothetical protein